MNCHCVQISGTALSIGKGRMNSNSGRHSVFEVSEVDLSKCWVTSSLKLNELLANCF